MANLTAVAESVNAQGPDLLARRRLGAGSRTTTQHPEPMRVQSFAVAAVLAYVYGVERRTAQVR